MALTKDIISSYQEVVERVGRYKAKLVPGPSRSSYSFQFQETPEEFQLWALTNLQVTMSVCNTSESHFWNVLVHRLDGRVVGTHSFNHLCAVPPF